MSKLIDYSTSARSTLKEGVDELANAVKLLTPDAIDSRPKVFYYITNFWQFKQLLNLIRNLMIY